LPDISVSLARFSECCAALTPQPCAAGDGNHVLQTVREHLFGGAIPGIRAYNGAGTLEQWIKVVTIRSAIDLHRTDKAIPCVEGACLRRSWRRNRTQPRRS
jgi:hypothetical protein